MILMTYRIKERQRAFSILDGLYRAVLYSDPHWHYFLDSEGITLRFSPIKEKAVCKYLDKNLMHFIRKSCYDPSRHEYPGLGFLGEDLANLFHDMSVLLTKYPHQLSFYPVLERLNHGLINMGGTHNFGIEADIYLLLAEERLALIKHRLPLPRWLYHVYHKMKTICYKPEIPVDGLL